jgi:hydrogenase/urease accessory protein HupE
MLPTRWMFCVAVVATVGVPLAFAHDPGLSTLAVRVGRADVVATLSIDAADVRMLAGAASHDEPRTSVAAWIGDAVRVGIDARPLDAVIEEVVTEDSGAMRVTLRFDRPAGRVVSVRSGIAERAGRGHRTLVSIVDDGGRKLAERLTEATDRELDVTLEVLPPAPPVSALGFFQLGVEHILTGYDHMLFLAGLLLAAWRARDALVMISAFTAAHSLTLALATLTVVSAPAQIVEPLIAASMIYVGAENVLRREAQSRWPVAFGFGLVHGLAFSGALRELGVGEAGTGAIAPLALFNAGVEVGQIAVALVVLPLVRFAQSRPALRRHVLPACSAGVAITGGWWLVERLR